ncbi:hypothetical protein [Hydrogenophaga sp.]|uniref:hypothetical protein n=1 Tax=Hydrogenophaga sp. TaxID=1904254 RepID=UPI003D13071A
MDILILALAVASCVVFFNAQAQRRRIALLGRHLGRYQIEALMENITQGYLRALGEDDPARRDQIWSLLNGAEASIAEQFGRFASDFAKVDTASARVSRLPLAWASQLFPSAGFDLRDALRIHARGIADAAANQAQRSPRDKAFLLSAELFLMQHTCHWYCRSRATASARLLRRHQTSHAQVLAAVSPETRRAYAALTGV